ncbi:hypothetical protein [Dishui Lake phycodnavirus 4]|nr:hypothetical protein [Dishui Lake phycodnavirus 4]
MEGNFLSRFNNTLDEYSQKIKNDPNNKSMYENEMATYIMKCMPYMSKHADAEESDVLSSSSSRDNVFMCRVKKGLERKDIYVDYLVNVEKINVDKPFERKQDICGTCEQSNIIFLTDTSDIVCDRCGRIVDTIAGEELTYREEQESTEKIINYSYKRENHFNEWLSQFQAQEMTNIPPDVIEKLRLELKKMKIKKLEEITHAKVRGLLKKLKLNKYYEHVPYISNILNGIKPPNMLPELEEKLRIMFKDIQKPFDKYCPTERKNFLSYSYVLYKFCELLGEDQYLQYFPLLKSKEKLYQQDVIFKKICNELRWEFIATI